MYGGGGGGGFEQRAPQFKPHRTNTTTRLFAASLTSTPTSRISIRGVWCQWRFDGFGGSTARSQTQLYASV